MNTDFNKKRIWLEISNRDSIKHSTHNCDLRKLLPDSNRIRKKNLSHGDSGFIHSLIRGKVGKNSFFSYLFFFFVDERRIFQPPTTMLLITKIKTVFLWSYRFDDIWAVSSSSRFLGFKSTQLFVSLTNVTNTLCLS